MKSKNRAEQVWAVPCAKRVQRKTQSTLSWTMLRHQLKIVCHLWISLRAVKLMVCLIKSIITSQLKCRKIMQATGIVQGLIYRKMTNNERMLFTRIETANLLSLVSVTHVLAWWIRVRGIAQLNSLAIVTASLMKVRMTQKVRCTVKGLLQAIAHDTA